MKEPLEGDSSESLPRSRSPRKITLRGHEAQQPGANIQGKQRGPRGIGRTVGVCLLWAALALGLVGTDLQQAASLPVAEASLPMVAVSWYEIFTPGIISMTLLLLAVSSFCSASEVAYFSLHKLKIRSMNEMDGFAGKLVYVLMQHPGNLLTTVLMSNSIVNVLLSVVLSGPSERFFSTSLLLPPAASYPLALAFTTAVLVFFGEILPKVMVVQSPAGFAQFAAPFLLVMDRGLSPLRSALIWFTTLIFRLTGISRMTPAPFITDEELFSLLSEGEASGAIEQDERKMIQGILEFGEVQVREVRVPRRDMITLPFNATVADALELIRERPISRIPVIGENLDQIRGILFAKDLLPLVEDNLLEQRIRPLVRRAHYVPEAMSVAQFIRTAQRLRTHIAIVVDEYGGTEGLITLDDALREVVGAIDEKSSHEEAHTVLRLSDHSFEVDGGFPLWDLEPLTGLQLETPEHTTVAGFLMERIERLPVAGDEVEYEGVHFRVEEMDGRWVKRVQITTPAGELVVLETPKDMEAAAS